MHGSKRALGFYVSTHCVLPMRKKMKLSQQLWSTTSIHIRATKISFGTETTGSRYVRRVTTAKRLLKMEALVGGGGRGLNLYRRPL